MDVLRQSPYVFDIATGELTWLYQAEALQKTALSKIAERSSLYENIHPEDLASRLKVEKQAHENMPYKLRYRFDDAEHKILHVEEVGQCQRCADTGNLQLRGYITLVDQASMAERRIDPLTRILTRHAFLETMTDAVRDSHNYNGYGAVLLLGIDRLGMINEAFGAHIGDDLILAMAEALKKEYAKSADDVIIGRVGGDILAVHFPGHHSDFIEPEAKHLLKTLSTTPFMTKAGPIRISVSLGSAIYPDNGRDARIVLTRAESALQDAKSKGKGCYFAYRNQQQIKEDYKNWLRMSESFIAAMDEGRIKMAFQPIVDSQSHEICYYETLIRMFDIQGDLVNAGAFMPAVENLGLARLVDHFTLSSSIETLIKNPDIGLSINVSAWTIGDVMWLEKLEQAVTEYPAIAERMVLEITETAALQDTGLAVSFVQSIKKLGCRIALDDFGAGYTSFQQIHILDVDIIKIDRCFVQELDKNAPFVQALQKLAEGLSLKTICEGVETEEEAEKLKKYGVDYMQGYFFGKPEVVDAWQS